MRGFIAHKTAISWLLHAKSAALLLMGDFKQQYLHITHDTGKTRRFRNPYRATKVLRHGEIIIDFIKKIHIKNIYGTRIRGSDLGIWELVAPDLRGVNLVPQTNPPPPAPPQQHSY